MHVRFSLSTSSPCWPRRSTFSISHWRYFCTCFTPNIKHTHNYYEDYYKFGTLLLKKILVSKINQWLLNSKYVVTYEIMLVCNWRYNVKNIAVPFFYKEDHSIETNTIKILQVKYFQSTSNPNPNSTRLLQRVNGKETTVVFHLIFVKFLFI